MPKVTSALKIRPQHSRKLERRSIMKHPSSASTEGQSPDRIRATKKESIQTLMMAKSSFVEELNLSSTSWCLFDSNLQKWIGFRERFQREIASLTKIMTSILAIELLSHFEISKDCKVRVTEQSSKMIGTTAELKSKVWIKVWDLLYGAMLPSGNDAAHLLAEILGYLIKKRDNQLKSLHYIDITNENTTSYMTEFIKLMNQKAEYLNLSRTTFSNPHGLQNALNTSCPKDMVTLCIYSSANPLFREVMNSSYFRYCYWEENKEIPEGLSVREKIEKHCKQTKKNWWNTNNLLKKGWEGVKTGQTGAAGSCLASLKNEIYIVVLNCKDNEARFTETEKIYEWYIQKKKRQSEKEGCGQY